MIEGRHQGKPEVVGLRGEQGLQIEYYYNVCPKRFDRFCRLLTGFVDFLTGFDRFCRLFVDFCRLFVENGYFSPGREFTGFNRLQARKVFVKVVAKLFFQFGTLFCQNLRLTTRRGVAGIGGWSRL